MGAGRTRIHFNTSANRASFNCAELGAVATVFWGYLVTMWCRIIQAAVAVFPGPWQAAMEIRRPPRPYSRRTSSCQGSRRTFSTSLAKRTGPSASPGRP